MVSTSPGFRGASCRTSTDGHVRSGLVDPVERIGWTAAVIALALLLLRGVTPFVDIDTWHQMALWRETLALGHLPLEDRFAYTPTIHPVMHHEWGMGPLMYTLAMHGGIVAIQVVRMALVAFIGAGTFLLARRRGASLAVLCSLAPFAVVALWAGLTAIRAQMLTLAFLVWLLWGLESDRAGRRSWIPCWLVLFVGWVNVHAGFVVGIGALGCHALEEVTRGRQVRHLLVVGVAMLGLVAVNPYGVRSYSNLWAALTMDRALIAEWGPIWRAHAFVVPVYLVSLLVVAYAMARLGFRSAVGWPLVLLAAEEALRHQRQVSIYAVVWASAVPAWVEQTPLGVLLRRFWVRRRVVAAALSSAAVVGIACSDLESRVWELRVPTAGSDQSDIVYPAGAVAYLRSVGFAGNLFVPFEFGAYVSWNLHPRVKVSLDSRFEAAYPPGLLAEHLEFYLRGPRWRDILMRYPSDAILVRRGKPIEAAMRGEATWLPVYRDDCYVIFARHDLDLPVVDRAGEPLAATFP
jgi:hypothetical protein